MININVKNIQNGEIVSDIKEVVGVYATFIRYEESDVSVDNFDLQQRLNPLATIETNSDLIEDSFIDSFENILLQKYLYSDLNIELPENSNIKPNKIVQIWTFTDNNLRQLFSLVSSCFGSGAWTSSEKWSDTELWKY